MTTVAWDGKEMAADSQATQGDQYITYTVKIFKTDEYIMGFAGAIDDGYILKAVLDGEIKSKDCNIGKGFHALVWTEEGLFEYYSSVYPIPSTDKYVAAGSGAGLALAAMNCGKTAKEAIEIAKKLDIYTGGKVIAYSWDTTKKKGKKKNDKKNDIGGSQEQATEQHSDKSEPMLDLAEKQRHSRIRPIKNKWQTFQDS